MSSSSRPSNAPHRIPLWAWLRLKLPGKFHYGPRRLPAWFWAWRAWRLHPHRKPKPKPKPRARTMHMYDDVNIDLIPKNAEAVAGYVGGRYPTWKRIKLAIMFPHAKKLSIAVASYQDADCLDVEPGDAPIYLAPGWVKRQLHLGNGIKHPNGRTIPVVYTAASWGEKLIDTLSKAGLRYGIDYLWWSAHYTYREHYCGPVCGFGLQHTAHATQFTDRALRRSLDESICSPEFWG